MYKHLKRSAALLVASAVLSTVSACTSGIGGGIAKPSPEVVVEFADNVCGIAAFKKDADGTDVVMIVTAEHGQLTAPLKDLAGLLIGDRRTFVTEAKSGQDERNVTGFSDVDEDAGVSSSGCDIAFRFNQNPQPAGDIFRGTLCSIQYRNAGIEYRTPQFSLHAINGADSGRFFKVGEYLDFTTTSLFDGVKVTDWSTDRTRKGDLEACYK